jgi:hypothetical protein
MDISENKPKRQTTYWEFGSDSSGLSQFAVCKVKQDLIDLRISLLLDFFVLFGIEHVLHHLVDDASLVTEVTWFRLVSFDTYIPSSFPCSRSA